MTQDSSDPWISVAAARLPRIHLDALGPVRDRLDIRIHRDGEDVWVLWKTSRREVIECLLPVPDVEFFTIRGNEWYPYERRIPIADRPPGGEGRSLSGELFPERLQPHAPDDGPRLPIPLGVVRGGEPKPATALSCLFADLGPWADRATTAELAVVSAASSGQRILLRGSSLPAIGSARRYWGENVLIPIGFRPSPDLAPALIRSAVMAANDELVILDEDGIDVVPQSAFQLVTRAGLRHATLGTSSPGEYR